MVTNIDIIKKGALVLGGLAILVVVIITILTGFDNSTALRTLSEAELNVTLGQTNTTTNIGTNGQYPYLQTAICQNATGILTSFNSSLYTVVTGDYTGGGITLNYANGQSDSFQGSPVDCDITYLADTKASNTARAFITALAVFGSFAGVLIIGLMGFALFRLFNPGKKNREL